MRISPWIALHEDCYFTGKAWMEKCFTVHAISAQILWIAVMSCSCLGASHPRVVVVDVLSRVEEKSQGELVLCARGSL